MAPLNAPFDGGRTEPPVISLPASGRPKAQMVTPQDADGATAPMIAPLGAGRAEVPVVTAAAGYLVKRLALDAGCSFPERSS